MAGKVTFSFLDAGGERSTTSFAIVTLTNANIDGIIGAAGEVDDLRDAIVGVTLGQTASVKVLARDSDKSSSPATAPEAQRELKWLVEYSDDVTGQVYQAEIPCPDITDATLYNQAPTKEIDLTDALWVTFVTAFEALVRSADGNAVTVIGGRLVGRNL